MINKFKEEEVDVSIKLCRALDKEKEKENPTGRKKLNIISDALLVNYKKMLGNKEISIDTFIKYLIELFNLKNLSKSKNLIYLKI